MSDRKHVLEQIQDFKKMQQENEESLKTPEDKKALVAHLKKAQEEGIEFPSHEEILQQRDQEKKATERKDLYNDIWEVNEKSGKAKLLPTNLASLILFDNEFLTIGEDRLQTFLYKEGRFVKGGNVRIAKECQTWTKGKIKNAEVQEVIGQIQRRTWKERDVLDSAPEYLCNANNVVVNLKTGETIPHSPDFYFTHKLEWDYVPGSDCPEIKNFLSQVLKERDLPTVQEFVGFCLYRRYFIKKAMIFWGGRDRGKTTTINLIVSFLGQGNTSNVSLHKLLCDKFAAQDLHGKLLNFYDDLSYKNLNDVGAFKIAVGSGYMAAEKKFGELFKFLNYAKQLFSTNKFSAVIDSDDLAFYDRWLIIQFLTEFDSKTADRNILERLTTKEEMQGFFIWALEGLKRLLESGEFTYDKTAEDNRNIMEADSNSVSAFILDCIEKKQGEWTPTSELYEAYIEYCNENDKPKETQDKFSKVFGKKASFAIPKQKDHVISGKKYNKLRGYLHVKIGNTNNTFSETMTQENSNTFFNKYDLKKRVTDVMDIIQLPCHVCGTSPSAEYDDNSGKPICRNCMDQLAELKE